MLLIVAMFALMWVLMIRPQRKRQHAQKLMLASLDAGDEVLTVGGLYGIVQEVEDDDTLVVEIADRIHVRVSRRAVASVTKPDPAAESEESDVGEDEGSDEAEADELSYRADEVTDEGDEVTGKTL